MAAGWRDRPSLREAISSAVVAASVGAIVALTTAPVAAAPGPSSATAGVASRAAITTGPRWVVSPRAARPGEVVHVRTPYRAAIDQAGKPVVPQILFAFLNDLRHPVQGHIYPAEGTFGVDLVVPPGTDWGLDPIVWVSAQLSLSAIPPDRLTVLASRNPLIPFVATRSAQPPLWNR